MKVFSPALLVFFPDVEAMCFIVNEVQAPDDACLCRALSVPVG